MSENDGNTTSSRITLLGRDELMSVVTGQENPKPTIKEHCVVGEVEAAAEEIKKIAEEEGLDDERTKRLHDNAEDIREIVRRHILGPDWEAREVFNQEEKVAILDRMEIVAYHELSDE